MRLLTGLYGSWSTPAPQICVHRIAAQASYFAQLLFQGVIVRHVRRDGECATRTTFPCGVQTTEDASASGWRASGYTSCIRDNRILLPPHRTRHTRHGGKINLFGQFIINHNAAQNSAASASNLGVMTLSGCVLDGLVVFIDDNWLSCLFYV